MSFVKKYFYKVRSYENIMHLTEKKINNIRKSFEENGYVTLKNFSKKQIQTVKKNLFRFLDKSKKNYRKRELHFAKNSDLINSVHHLKWPYIKKFKKKLQN